ncbi:MAG TPA: C25 family cysteine peptidase, partial [Clostridia bacterium]|nr:C25 family cysteine peptidase [Clostridia bacterium]
MRSLLRRRPFSIAGWVALLTLTLLQRSSAETSSKGSLLTLNCEFHTPRLTQAGEYTRVNVEGCAPLQRIGAPLLPFRTVKMVLPPGARIERLQTDFLGEAVTFSVTNPVEYGRTPVAVSRRNQASKSVRIGDFPDPHIYASEQPYPASRAELVSVQSMAGYQIAFIRVFPVQYLPAKGQLIFASDLQIKATLASSHPMPQPLLPPRRAMQHVRERVAAIVDNSSGLQAYEVPQALSEAGEGYDYLLITKADLVPAFQPLVDLKVQQGLSVKVETTATISAASSGRDMAEKIRNYLRYAYTNWGISYVLLGGDISVVPCRVAYVPVGTVVESPMVPTDLYYACLDGSWNSDNDSKWGEPNDGEGGQEVDLLAELYVGRAPVDTVAEVNTLVAKMIRYATLSHAHRTNALFLAETLENTSSGPAQGGDMLEPLLPLFNEFEVKWLDDRFTTPAWTRTDAVNALNQSPHVVLFNGHADWVYQTLFGWGNPITRSIEIPDLDKLTNQWPFLAYSVGCDVGRFDDPFWDSLGEELLKRHSRGAFGAVFNTRE